MSCCGNKRKEWLKEIKSSPEQEKVENVSRFPASNKPDRIFEYTGDHSLTVNGASGKFYFFRYKGYKLTVDYIDSFALMAEKELRMIK